MENEKRLIMTEQDAIVAAGQELSLCRYIAECTKNPGMIAIHRKRCEWLSVIVALAKKAIKADAVEVVHGRWIKTEVGSNCSACGLNVMSWSGNYDGYEREKGICLMHYCPNCGAKMDGGNEDE